MLKKVQAEKNDLILGDFHQDERLVEKNLKKNFFVLYDNYVI